MTYQFATIIVTATVAVNLRKLSQMLDRAETDGMFKVELSATGELPATHYLSNGMVPRPYITAITSPARLKTAADAAYAKEGAVQPFTLAQITTALSKCTIGYGELEVVVDGVTTLIPESPFEMLARLNLQVIRATLP